MQKIGNITPTATSDGHFTNGSVATGVAPTLLDAAWFNTIQDELVAIVQSAGIALDPANNGQVLQVLNSLLAQKLTRSNPFGDIAADGQTAVKKALTNLSLDRYEQTPDETHIRSPDGKTYILVNNTGWGAWNTDTGIVPLALVNGGTGAKNASDARKNLNLQGFSSTNDQSVGAYNYMLSPNNNYSLVMANSGTWGAQDSSGKTVALPVDRGGTGAVNPADARTNLGLKALSVQDIAPVANGGTGATTADAARTNLGLGPVATMTTVPVASGGTGATTAADARTNLGLGNASTYTVGSGPNQIPDMNSFTKGSGWQKLPGGKILQWFQATTATSGAVQVNFPIPFISGANMIVASPVDVNVPNWASAAIYNASSCLVSAYDGSKVRVATTVYIFAIGE
ncbi:hypothetical protein [Mixta calida]|uniref:gp53-like domain-containing protein n=1 Tax=Mixta calida TaxID=665913 RepID=UPI002906599A|nr:hypothetical protein [Mixta calida]MDU4291138.1 hypothetical protein [Mixta calida]